jgi:putative salt-induced outer membrane protein
MTLRALLPAVVGLAPLIGLADDAPPPPPPQGVWTGKGQAGYVSSRGNSDSKSANAMLDMALVEGPWKHTFHLAGLYGQSGGIVSAERWDTGGQSNYDLTRQVFAFGGLRFEHDLFSGFQYQASGTVGLGYKFFDSNALKLSAQAGIGYRKLRPEDIVKDDAGRVITRTLEPSQDGPVGAFGVLYSQALTHTTTLSDTLLIETSSSDTLTTNALALAVKISTKLALSVGYHIIDNSKPPAGVKNLDTLETINLVYAF